MRRRTRKQWYQYHLAKAQEDARDVITSVYSQEIERIRGVQEQAWKAFTKARENEPVKSKLLAFFGPESQYRIEILTPLKSDLAVADRALSDALERQRQRLEEATRQGTENYLEAREQRRQETEARDQRVAQREYERRLRYLEVSPAIRSAARPLKEHIIKQQSEDGLSVTCFYCHIVISAGASHLEHKRPISRGGTNSRANLVLSCAPCNLRKARKTHEEFIRELGGGAP
ncbi:MAG: HNH endonuclease [Planctomycetes bacterium]|nr:HNH endonuclease [Planctomycetota bacterium]